MPYNETSELCAWLIEYLAPTFFYIPMGVIVKLYIELTMYLSYNKTVGTLKESTLQIHVFSILLIHI